jgi:hypothetical protein
MVSSLDSISKDYISCSIGVYQLFKLTIIGKTLLMLPSFRILERVRPMVEKPTLVLFDRHEVGLAAALAFCEGFIKILSSMDAILCHGSVVGNLVRFRVVVGANITLGFVVFDGTGISVKGHDAAVGSCVYPRSGFFLDVFGTRHLMW